MLHNLEFPSSWGYGKNFRTFWCSFCTSTSQQRWGPALSEGTTGDRTSMSQKWERKERLFVSSRGICLSSLWEVSQQSYQATFEAFPNGVLVFPRMAPDDIASVWGIPAQVFHGKRSCSICEQGRNWGQMCPVQCPLGLPVLVCFWH